MKRVKFACLEQTIYFLLKDDIPKDIATQDVKKELEDYKQQLRQKNKKYKVIEENIQPDGSIIFKIKKQYNNYDCGEYLN